MADVILVAIVQQGDLYLDVLADGCAIVGWLVHAGAVAALQNTAFSRTRGPPSLLLLVLLSVPNVVVTLMIYCDKRECLNLPDPLQLARFALAAARTFPLLVYLLAFAFPCVGDAGYSLYVNAVDGAPLVPDTGETVAEDGSGCLSRLLYLWLTPLLRRGQRGELHTPADVYHLPPKLRTSAVCRRFQQCREAVGGPEADVGLLTVLHKAFGPRYYWLGLLKLLVNALSFAGPLLLGRLVNFMEEEGAAASTGAWCVLGLFAATLLSSVLRNVFVFEVSKVALSARAALVAAVYSKALGVGGSGLAAFALGEVVNLMSTDTDRVVNFFNSFHELWSLPVQFSVTLYLLYVQVGVAFLGGLCVALLLVPLNKLLASRILSNNRHMLRHKDERVKVRARVSALAVAEARLRHLSSLPAHDRNPLWHPRHQVLQLGASFHGEGGRLSRAGAVPPQGLEVPGRHVCVHLGRAARGRLHPHLRHVRAAGKPADCGQGGNIPKCSVQRGRAHHLLLCRFSLRWLWWEC